MKLKKEQMIELVKEHRKCTVYKVVNYEKFNQQSNQQGDLYHQGLEANANQQNNHLVTISQPSVNQQLTTKEQGSNKVNNVNNVKASIDIVFSLWKSLDLVKHRTLTTHIKNQITWKLREYSLEDLKHCITTYSEVLNGLDYVLDTRWALDDFFEKKHFDKFLPERDPYSFYRIRAAPLNAKQQHNKEQDDILRDFHEEGRREQTGNGSNSQNNQNGISLIRDN